MRRGIEDLSAFIKEKRQDGDWWGILERGFYISQVNYTPENPDFQLREALKDAEVRDNVLWAMQEATACGRADFVASCVGMSIHEVLVAGDMRLIDTHIQAISAALSVEDEHDFHEFIEKLKASSFRGLFTLAAEQEMNFALSKRVDFEIERTNEMKKRGAFTLGDGTEELIFMMAQEPDLLNQAEGPIARYLEYKLKDVITQEEIDALTPEDKARIRGMTRAISSSPIFKGAVSAPDDEELDAIAEELPDLYHLVVENPDLLARVKAYIQTSPSKFPEISHFMALETPSNG